ncbi:MAG: hypothetical protein R3B48_07020 [Kofleriaceae bacterium]
MSTDSSPPAALPAPTGAPAASRRALLVYVGRIREFDRTDWLVYLAWIGTMFGLVLSTGAFVVAGAAAGAPLPAEAWMVPVGALVFASSIAIDTIGHRTIYKEVLRGGEALVHHITIFCGVTSVVFLILAYRTHALWIPALVLTALSFIYSMVDEVFHWRRYVSVKSDPVEMWSHVGILVGHGVMMIGWWSCFSRGYPGVAETLAALGGS